MSPFQLGAALVVLAGALVAVSARDLRLDLGGLVVAMARPRSWPIPCPRPWPWPSGWWPPAWAPSSS